MNSNVIALPRAAQARPSIQRLGFFVRVGRNDHREMLDLIATGEQGIFGFVIDAQHVERHHDLMTEAKAKNYDLILDPKTQPMGTVGGHNGGLATLPWGLDRHHQASDFDGDKARTKAAQIVEMAVSHGFTEILGPTHLLSGANDVWLRRDINMMALVADEIARSGASLDLIYSLAVPMEILRHRQERQALIHSIADAPCDSIWLKIENFGDDASGEKTCAYIEACRDFHERGIPIVGDHLGGLAGLGALALGALGGMAHGVTMHQSFKASSWRRPPEGTGRAAARRVYIPQLDLMLKADVAQELLDSSPRIKAMCGCKDTHCCPHGLRDMIGRPARHALYQRAREIEGVSATPLSARAGRYVERVRRISDDVAAVAGMSGLEDAMQERLSKKQAAASRFRQAVAHFAEASPCDSVALAPPRRSAKG